jgi:hypothetical protein
VPSFLDLVNIGSESLVIPQGHGFPELFVAFYVLKVMIFAKFRLPARFQQILKDFTLILQGRGHGFPDLLMDVACKGPGQEGFDLHQIWQTVKYKYNLMPPTKGPAWISFFSYLLWN